MINSSINLSSTSPSPARDHWFQTCDKFSRNYNRMLFKTKNRIWKRQKAFFHIKLKLIQNHIFFSNKKSIERRTRAERSIISFFHRSRSHKKCQLHDEKAKLAGRSEWGKLLGQSHFMHDSPAVLRLSLSGESRGGESKIAAISPPDWHDDSAFPSTLPRMIEL